MSHDSPPIDVFTPKVNAVAQNFIDELLKEQANLPDEGFPLLNQVIEDAIDRVYSTGRIPGRDFPADVFKQKRIKLAQNVYLPTKLYPTFNFKGKILGPKGNTLKRLHNETMCNIAIKGRDSMREPEREEKLRQSGDPIFNHLNKNLHVEIATVAPPAEAYARMAYALTEIRKYIIPDKNDEISQEQYRELLEINPDYAKKHQQQKQKSVFSKLRKIASDVQDEEEDNQSDSSEQEKKHESGSDSKAATSSTSFIEKAKEIRAKPYPKRSHESGTASKAATSSTSFIEKANEIRAKPYPKRSPAFKK